jgi:zinc protease
VTVYYTKASNRTVGLFVPATEPDRAEIPAAPDLVADLKDYRGRTDVAVGEAFEATPENIEGRVERITAGGVRLVLLPKQTRGDAVVGLLRLRFGDQQALMGRSLIGRLTGQMLMRGTTKHTRQQIQDELDRLKARMNVGGAATGVTVNLETVRANLPAVLELAVEVLRQPAFPASEFETLRQQALAALENQKTEPQAIVQRAFQRHLSPYPKGDVRYMPTIDEEMAELRSITLDQTRAFHAEFYGASNGELAIVGDFAPEEVRRIVSAQLGSWKSPKRYERVTNPHRRIEPAHETFETPDKANAFFLAGTRLNLRDEDADYPPLLFANYLIGQGLNSRLFARIRGKEGLSYGIGSVLIVQPGEDSAPFIANAISAPENASKVEASFRDEMSAILKDGFTDAEIAAGKTSWLQAQQVGRSQDLPLAARLAGLAEFGRTMGWEAELQKKVQALTPQQIVAALRRHIDLSAMTVMKGGDFKTLAKN